MVNLQIDGVSYSVEEKTIEFALSEAREALKLQREEVVAANAKCQGILGFTGLLIGASGLQSLTTHPLLMLPWLGLAMVTMWFAFQALTSRSIAAGESPQILRQQIGDPVDLVRLNALDGLLFAVESNWKALAEKQRALSLAWYLMATTLSTLALVNLGYALWRAYGAGT